MNRTVGRALRTIRKDAGFSLRHVADIIGISEGMLSRHETGQHPIDVPMLFALAKVYRRTPADLLAGLGRRG